MGYRVGLALTFISAAFAISIASSATETSVPNAAADDTPDCTVLDSEWKTAEASCSTNANLGRARSLAREAETKCKSQDTAQRKLGITKYQSALRLCRKSGDGH